MDLIIATNNKGKLKEFREILSGKFDNIFSLSDKNINIEIEETGSTFFENALIKAQTIAKIANIPSLGDDSGLCVEALDGAPGIYSARYAGENCDWTQNNLKIIEDLKGKKNRKAYFIASIVVCYPDGKFISAEGRAYGKMLESPKGDNGFGYDPLFLSDELGVTFAEADSAIKNKVSHRAKALKELLKQL